MLSNRFILVFLIGAAILPWVLPASALTPERLPPPAPTSPDRDLVDIVDVAPEGEGPFVAIDLMTGGRLINLTGWSIVNERGERAEIGEGAEFVRVGEVPALSPIVVSGTGTVIVSFRESPLGASFRVNACTSYLRGGAPVVPPIAPRCPDLSSYPGWETLDDACKLTVGALPRCQTSSSEHIGRMSAACSSFISTILTYASCIEKVGASAFTGEWRVYVPKPKGFLSPEDGSVTLYDERGLPVDSMDYQSPQ